ncbi:MAG: energy-coupling factor transporter ATPase [Butyrivibrio sp.]|nr:energy-coupling factor transporter ATPase [Butyrivibrio sp.]
MSIILDNISYTYGVDSGFSKQALKNVSLVIEKNEYIGLIGHTGSGKSTLAQMLNGLLRATEGRIFYDEQDIYDDNFKMKELRKKVGLVFQYPEHQLFESTVFADVCFGPKNIGLNKKETELRAFEALELVGFEKELFYSSPFELSGGQKRRAAIAGVVAMRPEVLILDEPTAGLDPKGRDEIFDMVTHLKERLDMTVILVSHSMEDVARYVDRILVMNDGKLMYDDTPKAVFSHYKELEAIGLAAPEVTYVMNDLIKRGINVDASAITLEEGVASILEQFRNKGRI